MNTAQTLLMIAWSAFTTAICIACHQDAKSFRKHSSPPSPKSHLLRRYIAANPKFLT